MSNVDDEKEAMRVLKLSVLLAAMLAFAPVRAEGPAKNAVKTFTEFRDALENGVAFMFDDFIYRWNPERERLEYHWKGWKVSQTSFSYIHQKIKKREIYYLSHHPHHGNPPRPKKKSRSTTSEVFGRDKP